MIDDWRDTDINVDSLWLFPERKKGGRHSNLYHGNFIPQIPYQLIKRYTKEKEIVLELFSGSGTTLFECEDLNRNYIGFDINQDIIDYVENKIKEDNIKIHYKLNNCDVTDRCKFSFCMIESLKTLGKEKVDFLIMHPPYLDIIKFTDKKEDLSQISDVSVFIDKIKLAAGNAIPFIKKGGYFSIVMGDLYRNKEVVPLSFYVMCAVKELSGAKLKGIVIKNIEGNRGKLGANNIWKYRALKSDYFLFKHEYILVFRKQ